MRYNSVRSRDGRLGASLNGPIISVISDCVCACNDTSVKSLCYVHHRYPRLGCWHWGLNQAVPRLRATSRPRHCGVCVCVCVWGRCLVWAASPGLSQTNPTLELGEAEHLWWGRGGAAGSCSACSTLQLARRGWTPLHPGDGVCQAARSCVSKGLTAQRACCIHLPSEVFRESLAHTPTHEHTHTHTHARTHTYTQYQLYLSIFGEDRQIRFFW